VRRLCAADPPHRGGPVRRGAARAHDEVDLASFEARLDSQRHLDTSRSLVGPETATWRIFGESVVLLGGARALLMQFAHPLVQGLADHSSFLTEPGDRFHRTLQSMYGLAFGDGPTMLRMAREVHEKHARVVGHYHAHGRPLPRRGPLQRQSGAAPPLGRGHRDGHDGANI
jgi:hypothetical protein